MRLLRVIFLRKKFFCKKIFLLSFLSIGHERATNGEYISGENYFFEPSWSPGESSEERHIEHGENTFMSIKIDRVIRFCSTFFFKVWYWWCQAKNGHFRSQRHVCQLESWTEAGTKNPYLSLWQSPINKPSM